MSKGCPCKNATDTNPNCMYCAGKRTGAYGNQNDGNRQNYDYNPAVAYDPNAGQYNNDQNSYPYGTGSDYSSYPSQKESSDGGEEESQAFELRDNATTLLKAAAVFSFGCFLTTQMTNVANELG